MIITKFSKFNEEMNLKKALIGTLAATTMACSNPNSNTTINNVGTEVSAPRVVEPTKSILDAPKVFRMEEEFMTFGLDMKVTDDNNNDYGVVEQRTMSFTKTFELLNSNGGLIAKGSSRAFSFTTVVEVEDSNGVLIGTLEEEIFENIFSLGSLYTIKDKNGKVLGKSKKLDFFTTDVTIKGSGGTITMEKEFLTFGDQWEVKYNGNIDKRLIAFIPSFISSSQKEKKKEEEENNEK